MSGITLRRARDGTQSVSLKSSSDLQDGGADDDTAVAPFSYLFSSPAERRVERKMKELKEKKTREEKKNAGKSKHQIAMEAAEKQGLLLEGMSRKQKRDFLRLTVSKEQQEAEERARNFKLHDLMIDKLAWYQQGPYPIDLIAEKLVVKKAEKKARQQGLRYNYLRPHASWLARRAERRRQSVLVGLGRHVVFDEDGTARDALTNAPITDWALPSRQQPAEKHSIMLEGSAEAPKEHPDAADSGCTIAAEKPLPESSITLVDPGSAASHRYVRTLMPDKYSAEALQKANLSTNFLSAGLVQPNVASPEEERQRRYRLFIEHFASKKSAQADPVDAHKNSKTSSRETVKDTHKKKKREVK